MATALLRRFPVLLLLAALTMTAPAAGGDEHGAGIAVIASDVGNSYSVEDLAAFVETARIRDVIVDWAWIAHHWPRTDFDGRTDRLVLGFLNQGRGGGVYMLWRVARALSSVFWVRVTVTRLFLSGAVELSSAISTVK